MHSFFVIFAENIEIGIHEGIYYIGSKGLNSSAGGVDYSNTGRTEDNGIFG